uniref:DB domain-containing protein n=1 Tax=Steinernema glaseri TaxID=37863 RepID=A0A1I7ZZ10_9BILA
MRILILMVALAASGFPATLKLTMRQDDPLVVARRCCAPEHVQCCRRAFNFLLPVQCANMTVEERMEAVHCAQKGFHGEKQLQRLNINDFECCGVFGNNDNDPENLCQERCLHALQTPSLPVAEKLQRIRFCRLNNENVVKCFHKCVHWQRHHNTDGNASFVYGEHCNWVDRMLPGKMYIGPPV